MAVTGLRGCYGVRFPLLFPNIAMCGSYGADLPEDVTAALELELFIHYTFQGD